MEAINSEIEKYSKTDTIDKKAEKNIMQTLAKLKPSQERKYKKIVNAYKLLFKAMSNKRKKHKKKQ